MNKLHYLLVCCCILLAACSENQEDVIDQQENAIPENLLGQWLYTDNESDDYYFCQALGFTQYPTQVAWQISQQEYNEITMCGGKLTYDSSTQTITLECQLIGDDKHVQLDGQHIKTIRILSITEDELTAIIGGKTIVYSKNNTGIFLPEYTWSNGFDDNLNPVGNIPSTIDNGIDLGLSVNWAEYNMGAQESFDAGGNYGWGDITGSYYTKNLDMYPSANPPLDISGSEYDIVTAEWGNGWRIPTRDEMQELVDNCDITWRNSLKAWEFTSHINGNSIYLPYVPVRSGKNFYEECGYWTSTLDTEGGLGAYSLYTLKEGRIIKNIESFARYYGMAIRPVKDNDNRGNEISKNILGTWSVLMDDPSWKTVLELQANGKYVAIDYYDIEGDNTFLEYSGKYNGTYSLTNDGITIDCSDINNSSVLIGIYKFREISNSYFEAVDDSGWTIYATKVK